MANVPRNTQATLLGLPRELRDKIYEFVFEDLYVKNPFALRSRDSATGIMTTCKQLHHESTEAYYKCATFHIAARKGLLYKWLQTRTVRQRSLIRDLHFSRAWSWGCYTYRAHFESVVREMEDRVIALRKGAFKIWAPIRIEANDERPWVWEWTSFEK